MPTIQQKRRVAEIRKYFQEECKENRGWTVEQSRSHLQSRFHLDNPSWYRLRGTLDRRPQTAVIADDRAVSAPEPEEEAGFELTIPAGLSGEAKDSLNKALEHISIQSSQIAALTQANAQLESRMIQQSKLVQFLKGVGKELIDAI